MNGQLWFTGAVGFEAARQVSLLPPGHRSRATKLGCFAVSSHDALHLLIIKISTNMSNNQQTKI